MTISHPTQTVRGAETARGVQTNGIGQITTAHMNLTRDMTRQVQAEIAQQEKYARRAARRKHRRVTYRQAVQTLAAMEARP
jgi:glutamate synthase domain-containing protein 1